MPPPATRTALAFLSAALVAGLSPAVVAQSEAEADELQLRRVMLSTGGVGYFEFEAAVSGSVDLSIGVRLDQVNDVLKSIVVYDDQGGVGEISLPGRQPLVDVFRELPFDQADLTSPVALLNALTGREVEVDGPRGIEGRIIAVEPETEETPSGGLVTRHRLSLLTEDGIQQLVLEQADAVRLVDEDLQGDVDDALAALAAHTVRDGRELSIRMAGEAARTVRVAYVAEAPLWKGTYRLTLPADGEAGEAALQGWAVLENLSGEDWEGVDLTVVSGNPVTFRQALYDAYYVDRPEVPVEVLGRVLPPVDEGGVPRTQALPAEVIGTGVAGLLALEDAAMEAMPAPSPTARAEAPPPLAQLQAAVSTEAATQVIHRVPWPVSVPDGHTLLVPIVDRTAPVARVSVFRVETHPRHPLAAVRLDNDGETGLPPGVLTLYERAGDSGVVAFVGDARLDTLPAGDDRLVSFAVDQAVSVDHSRHDTRRTSRASIVDGVMERIVTETARTVYTIDNTAGTERTVLIEHPRAAGWTLVEPGEDSLDETTPTHHRLAVAVPPGATERLEVVMERPRGEQVVLSDVSPRQIEIYAEDTALPPEIREEMRQLSGFLQEVEAKQRALDRLVETRDDTVRQQERIRRNLDSVPADSDLHRRYLETMGAQEDELERLGEEIDTAEAALDEAYVALRDYAGSLVVRPAE